MKRIIKASNIAQDNVVSHVWETMNPNLTTTGGKYTEMMKRCFPRMRNERPISL